MNPKIKKILRIVPTLLLAIVVILLILLQGLRFIGLTPYSVLSGSMESVYPTGSLLYVRDVEPSQLEVGDVITYEMTGGTLCTHRIVELVPDEEDSGVIRFRTKGDENDSADSVLVGYNAVVGKAVFCIPFLGYLATYMAVPPGKYLAIAVVAAIILIEIISSLAFGDKDKDNSQTEQN